MDNCYTTDVQGPDTHARTHARTHALTIVCKVRSGRGTVGWRVDVTVATASGSALCGTEGRW